MNHKLSKTLFVGAAAVPALAGMPASDAAAAKPDKPNVIFILLDDAGYGDFGCYGQTRTETPNIDALAARGIRFTDMYSAAPLSSPARCGLLTGMHSGHAQIRANDEMTHRGDVWNHAEMLRDSTLEGQAPMRAGTPTLGSEMKRAGYRTAMIGKWGVGGPTSESTPNKWASTNISAASASVRRTATTLLPLGERPPRISRQPAPAAGHAARRWSRSHGSAKLREVCAEHLQPRSDV